MLRLQRKKMHAAVFYGPNNIANEEIYCSSDYFSRDQIEFGEGVLLRVKACAVCGYDVRVYRNGHHKVTPPVVLGHEICAETDKTITIGNGTRIKGGSRVAVSPIIPCLNCKYCYNKQYNLCINLKEIGSTINGGFAEFVRIPEQILKIRGLVPIPNDLTDEEAALLEPLSCCLNGFSRIGPIAKGSIVVIIGDGPIGLLHLQLLKTLYNTRTIVVGKIPQRIQKAKSMGADAAIVLADDDGNNDHTELNLDNVTDCIGYADIVIIATSSPKALDMAVKIAAKNSKINIFAGIPKAASPSISLDANWIHYKQISITGSFSATPAMLKEAARLVSDKQVDLSKIITHRYSLDNIQKAMLATEKYYGLRAVINNFS